MDVLKKQIEGKEEKRTLNQNDALHEWCEWIATAYNQQGLDVRSVIEANEMDLMWSKDLVKKILLHHILWEVWGKTSTTEILKNSGEIEKMVDMMTKFNAKMGIGYIPFPSNKKE
jgi:hypothetical protein